MSNSVDASPQLEARVAALQRQATALEEAINRGGKVRRRLLLAVLVFVVVFGWLFTSAVKQLISDESLQALQAEGQKRFAANQEDLARELQSFVDYSVPVLKSAFSKQAEKDSQKFSDALDAERKILQANLEERLPERFNARYKDLLAEHQQILRSEFPDLDEEKYGLMIHNLELGLTKLVKQYYADEFRHQLEFLAAQWEEFPAAAYDERLSQDIVGHLMELLGSQIGKRTAPETDAEI